MYFPTWHQFLVILNKTGFALKPPDIKNNTGRKKVEEEEEKKDKEQEKSKRKRSRIRVEERTGAKEEI